MMTDNKLNTVESNTHKTNTLNRPTSKRSTERFVQNKQKSQQRIRLHSDAFYTNKGRIQINTKSLTL